MEYRHAADGNTEELRAWLRAHPERVNVPAKGSNMTLLYTCISNCHRTDVASLQAGCSRYLDTVSMLCEEYRADVLAPNGGSFNTALHLAASTGATGIVRYLVDVLHTPVDKENIFNERPVQLAQRNGHVECAAILSAAAALQSRPPQQSPLSRGASLQHIHIGSSGGGGSSSGPGRFQSMTVSDSDDEEGAHAGVDGSWGGNGLPRQVRSDGVGLSSLAPQHTTRGSGVCTAPSFTSFGEGSSVRASPLPLPTLRRHASGTGAASFSGATASTTTIASTSLPPLLPGIHANSGAAVALPPPPPPPPLPLPVRPRREFDITASRVLANPDLQGFRSAYGDGFKYVQCSDHYELRGILPYTYRGTVYFTPVIISVYAPAAAAETSDGSLSPCGSLPSKASFTHGAGAAAAAAAAVASGAATGTSSPTASATPDVAPRVVYCRYRVCVNVQRLNDFAISRKAEYLDPISGAVLPAPGDDKYQTLTAYVRNVVVRNFEAVPPLIVPTSSYAFPLRPNVAALGSGGGSAADTYRHHHSHSAPSFMQNALPLRTPSHVRCATILRSLSRFGDGLCRYFPARHRIVAHVPLYSERKSAVLAIAQERPYTTTVGQTSPPPPAATATATAQLPASKLNAVEGAMPVAGGKAGVTQQVVVEAVAELHVRVLLQFTVSPSTGDAVEGGTYASPPRVYLVDAATRPTVPPVDATAGGAAAAALTTQCFTGLMADRESGEVRPELIRLSPESWRASGSVYDILVELQRALSGVLESFAMRYTNRSAATAAAAVASPHHAAASPPPAALDDFFTTPTTQASPTAVAASGTRSGGGGGGGGGGDVALRNSAGVCLYCGQALHASRVLLQPCGHDGLCGLCVQRLQSHCREEIFACPVCHGAVQRVMEVYI
ncbi:Ankyrin repeats (3 copies)/Ankyrin repeat [Novymonas esmeraldas]|uniref:Ankyrin repeats (3 copies)/Ankyrin repeat n=1 Tax=Novymonas esmeraldas TaxID=1808958 RepID=A0AAW0EY16_9TRYP